MGFQDLVRISKFYEPAFQGPRTASVRPGSIIQLEFILFSHATSGKPGVLRVFESPLLLPAKNVAFAALSGMNTISLGPQQGIRDFPDRILPRSMGVSVRVPFCSLVRINACAALGGRARQAFTQSDHLQHRDFLIRFHCETARPLHRTHHIHDSRSRNFDDVLLDIPLDCGADRSNRGGPSILPGPLLGICAHLVGTSVRCAGPAKLLQPHHWRKIPPTRSLSQKRTRARFF